MAKSNTIALSHKQIVALIKHVGPDRTVLVQGEAGVGKTSIAYELATDPAYTEHHFVKPIDCTQLSEGSIWMPDIDKQRGVSRELPNERFGLSEENRHGVEGSRPVLVCLDEIAKARQYIKDAIAPIVYERRLGDYVMPKGSVVFACTNLQSEGLGDTLQAHLRDRIVNVTMRKPTKDEWVTDFAIPNGLHESIIGACNEFPMIFDSFMDYGGKDLSKDNPYIFNPQAQQDKWVTPRSLHAASDIVRASKHIDEQTLQAALAGTIGHAFTGQLMSYIRFGNDLPEFDNILANPAKCPLPDNPTAQIVLVFKLITQVSEHEQAEAAVEYVLRMRSEMQTLFATTVGRTSSKVPVYMRVKDFGQRLLQENRKFFAAA